MQLLGATEQSPVLGCGGDGGAEVAADADVADEGERGVGVAEQGGDHGRIEADVEQEPACRDVAEVVGGATARRSAASSAILLLGRLAPRPAGTSDGWRTRRRRRGTAAPRALARPRHVKVPAPDLGDP